MMGDPNVKMGTEKTLLEYGEWFLDFCKFQNLVIGVILSEHRIYHSVSGFLFTSKEQQIRLILLKSTVEVTILASEGTII